MNDSNGKIYLNNAATSFPKPDSVGLAVKNAIDNLPGTANRGGIEDFNVLTEVRTRLAKLMNIENPERIALGANATWALNIGIFGLHFEKGDTVITTKAEHNSVLRPLFALEKTGLIKLVYVDCDRFGRIDKEAFSDAVKREKPKLTVFTHASNVTGAINDAVALCKIAKENNSIVLLDCSQTLGWANVDVKDLGADMIAFTGHKYLLGPQGTGGLYVSENLNLRPYMIGGTGIHSDLEEMPEEMPIHLEAGTENGPSFHGLLAALDWAFDNPIDYSAENKKLTAVKSGLKNLGAKIIEPPGECTPVVSFTIDGISPSEIGYILAESYDIICRTGLHCAPKIFNCIGEPRGTVRVSLSRFTTDNDINEFLNAVSDIII